MGIKLLLLMRKFRVSSAVPRRRPVLNCVSDKSSYDYVTYRGKRSKVIREENAKAEVSHR